MPEMPWWGIVILGLLVFVFTFDIREWRNNVILMAIVAIFVFFVVSIGTAPHRITDPDIEAVPCGSFDGC